MPKIGTSTMFSHNDAGFSWNSKAVGSMITLLKAVLVDGYDGKPSLGWTLEFEDVTNKVAVFRMKEGSRKYIRVSDNSDSFATIEAYTTMTDVDTGTQPTLDGSVYKLLYKTRQFGNAGIHSFSHWYIIGDGAGFYFLGSTYSGTSNSHCVGTQFDIHYIGDYVATSASRPASACFCTMLSNYVNTNYRWAYAMKQRVAELIRYDTDLSLEYAKGSLTPDSLSAYSFFGNNFQLDTNVNALTLGYPIYLKIGSTAVGQFPGMIDPFFAFIQSVANRDSVYFAERDVYLSDDGVNQYLSVAFVKRTTLAQYESTSISSENGSQRVSFRIGEGFRNVY